MKVFFFLIVSTLIIYASTSTSYCLEKNVASSAYDCQGLEVGTLGDHCCYYNFYYYDYTGNRIEYSGCSEISHADYLDIDASIRKGISNYAAQGININVVSLDCKSSYLILNLFSLLLFLL